MHDVFLTRFGDVSTTLFVSTTGQRTTAIDRTARPLLGIARPHSFSLLDAHSSPTIRQDYFTFSAKKRRRCRIKQSLHPQGMTTSTSPHKNNSYTGIRMLPQPRRHPNQSRLIVTTGVASYLWPFRIQSLTPTLIQVNS
jgi:hypothetical protein